MPHWSSNRAEHILLVVLLVEANSIFFIQKKWREFSHSFSLKPFWGRWSIFFLMTNWRIFFYIFCRKYWQTSDSPCASSWSLYFGLLQRSVLQLFLDGWRARITAHLLHQMVQRKRRVFSVSVPMTSETQMPCPEDANPSYNCLLLRRMVQPYQCCLAPALRSIYHRSVLMSKEIWLLS